MAERKGFEPLIRFPVYTISNRGALDQPQPSLQLYVQSIIRHLHIIQHRVEKKQAFFAM